MGITCILIVHELILRISNGVHKYILCTSHIDAIELVAQRLRIKQRESISSTQCRQGLSQSISSKIYILSVDLTLQGCQGESRELRRILDSFLRYATLPLLFLPKAPATLVRLGRMHRSRCRWCDRRGKYSRGRGEIIEGRGDWGPVHGDGGGRLDESIATALTRAIASRIRRRSALLSSGEADGRKCRLRRGWQLRFRLRLRLRLGPTHSCRSRGRGSNGSTGFRQRRRVFVEQQR